MDLTEIEKLCRLMRYYILLQTNSAQSGHTTSALSSVELASVLFFKYLRFDLENNSPLPPLNLRGGELALNDRFILSKGHASPLFYALFAAAGKISEDELMKYRSFDSVLEGHPSVRFPYTEGLTGSLGQGLSIGVGEALALRAQYQKSNIKNQNNHNSPNSPSYLKRGLGGVTIPNIFVLLGDGEMAEGQNWEAIAYAAFKKINNLIGIIDVNRLGQSEQTMYGHDPQAYAKRIASFGWRTYVVVDGHDVEMVDKAYSLALAQSQTSDMPAAIIAKTIKGKGVPFWEDKNGWHSKVLPKEEYKKAIQRLGEIDKSVKGIVQKPTMSGQLVVGSWQISDNNSPNSPSYLKRGLGGVTDNLSFTLYRSSEEVATKKAFGNALERLGSVYPELVVLDGDMKNSTHIDQFEKKYPDRFYQMYIAEQNLVSVAWGMANCGFKPLVCTFACFLTRAHDQFRLAALSDVTMYVCGAYAGVSLGKDGPSQMALEDMAMVRPLLNSTLLYPSDAISTEKLVAEMLKLQGIVYIKTTREPTPMIYDEKEEFVVGGSKVHQSSVVSPQSSDVVIIAAGITVHEALTAQQELIRENIAVTVIDCYSIKPIDVVTLKKAAEDSKAIITVEDHYAVGGLGDAVLEALSEVKHCPIYKLAVKKTPRSGTAEELLDFEDISARAIIKKVKEVLQSQ